MDKRTLTAFLLIAIIVLLTPAYYNLLYPTLEQEAAADSIATAQEHQTAELPTPGRSSTPTDSIVVHKEQTFAVETDFFSATISSHNGGSISSFLMNKYLLNGDGAGRVQLITEKNANNLLLSFRSVDGEDVALSGPWAMIRQSNWSFRFRQRVFDGYVYKTITFNPNSYLIDVAVDLSEIQQYISQGVYGLSWFNGLPVTEKNKKDDLNYFDAYIYTGDELHSPEFKKEPDPKKDHVKGATNWVAVRTKYFIAALLPLVPGVGGLTSGQVTQENDKMLNVTILLSATENPNTVLYLGPLEYARIKALGPGMDRVMNFGWGFIRPISKGVYFLLIKMNEFIPNYGLILILFSVLVKVLVYPLTKKSYESTKKMQAVQPQLNALKEKYKHDQKKMSQAQMALFKEHGVNPLGGCFPILLQMPLLFALFQVFRSTIELRGAPFILWIVDLSSPDAVVDLPFSIPLYGDHIAVLPILMGITMFVQQKMMATQTTGQQKFMSYFMTGFFLLLFNNFPSGLNLYYTLFNLLTILQQKYLSPAPPALQKK